MFNLEELKIKSSYSTDTSVEEKLSSFVGIKRNIVTGDLEFCLPKGFEEFPKDNFDAIKKMFFRTYKTYRKFFEDKKRLSDNYTFDGFSELADGYTLVGKDENVATYSKLNVFDSILDAYNELQIHSLQNRLSKSSEINYAKIEKYLHRGVYLDDDSVFIDEMEMPKKIIDLDSPTLVEMFCYLYCEIKNALEEEVESYRAKSLSQDFKEKHLSSNSSLFDQENFNETLAILKDTLNEIDKFTAYKDEDYWQFFNAIYTFLYGENEYADSEDGNIWGLDNFSFIWEELCFSYAVNEVYKSNRLLFADRFGKVSVYNGFKDPIFFVQLNRQFKRFLRPDLVVTDNDLLEDDFLDTLGRIFRIDHVQLNFNLNKFDNIKLSPLFDRHNFNDLWNIYNKWVEKNPSVKKNPEKNNYRNVADQHKNEFIEELMKYFFSLPTSQIINRKPLLFDFLVIDYKYVSEELFQAGYLSSNRNHDIKKQLVYEMALQSGYETSYTRSEFWIPGYFEHGEISEQVDSLNSVVTNNGLTVLKINFEYLQELYLLQ